jgi:hypothetical protein
MGPFKIEGAVWLPGNRRSIMVSTKHVGEHEEAAMNTLDNLRAEWIDTRRSLGAHIAYLEAGNKIHPIDQDILTRQRRNS